MTLEPVTNFIHVQKRFWYIQCSVRVVVPGEQPQTYPMDAKKRGFNGAHSKIMELGKWKGMVLKGSMSDVLDKYMVYEDDAGKQLYPFMNDMNEIVLRYSCDGGHTATFFDGYNGIPPFAGDVRRIFKYEYIGQGLDKDDDPEITYL
ncbi:hypothetical protein H4R24_005417 [Coemansia sp. RSA 988]|nr:hypothetical protein H4R24_005417 [Coemansia sp. RSA 988]